MHRAQARRGGGERPSAGVREDLQGDDLGDEAWRDTAACWERRSCEGAGIGHLFKGDRRAVRLPPRAVSR